MLRALRVQTTTVVFYYNKISELNNLMTIIIITEYLQRINISVKNYTVINMCPHVNNEKFVILFKQIVKSDTNWTHLRDTRSNCCCCVHYIFCHYLLTPKFHNS